MPDDADLAWYHTIQLSPTLATPGMFDHRGLVDRVGLPASLAGKRCLDVGSADGFWAFEMARRGATSVVSLELATGTEKVFQGNLSEEARRVDDGRAHQAFSVAREALGYGQVERRRASVYDLEPGGGTFDFVFVGNLLLHLSDPGRALQAMRSVVGAGGELLSFEALSLFLTVLHPRRPVAELWQRDEARWWTPNVAAHRRLLHAGGFEVVAHGGPVWQKFGRALPRHPTRVPKRSELTFWLVHRWAGVPSWWARTRPT